MAAHGGSHPRFRQRLVCRHAARKNHAGRGPHPGRPAVQAARGHDERGDDAALARVGPRHLEQAERHRRHTPGGRDRHPRTGRRAVDRRNAHPAGQPFRPSISLRRRSAAGVSENQNRRAAQIPGKRTSSSINSSFPPARPSPSKTPSNATAAPSPTPASRSFTIAVPFAPVGLGAPKPPGEGGGEGEGAAATLQQFPNSSLA